MFTTKPTPHASCSFRGSYRPCLITSCIAITFLGTLGVAVIQGAHTRKLPMCPCSGQMAIFLPRRSVGNFHGSEQDGTSHQGALLPGPPPKAGGPWEPG